MKHRQLTPIERQLRDRGVHNPAEFEAWLQARNWSWQKLDRGDYGLSLEHAVLLCTIEDPVLWAEAFLIEPETREPYKLWDYQKDSIRSYRQDVIHQDGAEVGKTREITVLTLWACCTGMGGKIRKPSILIGAPKQIFLDDIARAIETQVGVADGEEWKSPLKDFWLEPVRTPHKLFRLKTLNPSHPERPATAEIHFRPSGHDGEAFRGVHVNTFAIMEEAAKLKNKVQWTEFFRGMMPGCKLRCYSVPDGDRTTEFYRLCTEAIEQLPEGEPGMRKFRWPKTLMPPPFWTEGGRDSRKAKLVKLYGGEDASDYKRNVMGEWGDAENPVIRWDVLLPNVVDLTDYRKIVLGADGAVGTLYSEVSRIDLVMTEGRKSGQEQCTSDRGDSLDDFIANDDTHRRNAWADLLAPHLTHIDPRGVHWVGCDLGERNDPTEIVVSEQLGETVRDVLRIKAKGLPYHAQEELIYQVDRACGHRAFWGVDLGSAGTAVVKNLLNRDAYAEADFTDRLIGFHFQEAVDCVGEDGEALEQADADDNTVILRAPAKHWATVCMVQRLQHRGYQLAYDADVLNDYTSHTARAGTKWPIYDKKNDHTIDARRQQMLRMLRAQDGGSVDVFSGKTYDRRAA